MQNNLQEKTETDVYTMRQKTVKNIRLPADKIIFVDEKINKIDNSTAGLKKFYDAIEQARNNALQKIIIYHLGESVPRLFPNKLKHSYRMNC